MKFTPSFFGTQQHREFHYIPRFYDPEKERRKELFGAVDGSMKDAKPGERIRGSFRRRPGKDVTTRAQKIIGLVGMILFLVVLIYIAKFYALL